MDKVLGSTNAERRRRRQRPYPTLPKMPNPFVTPSLPHSCFPFFKNKPKMTKNDFLRAYLRFEMGDEKRVSCLSSHFLKMEDSHFKLPLILMKIALKIALNGR